MLSVDNWGCNPIKGGVPTQCLCIAAPSSGTTCGVGLRASVLMQWPRSAPPVGTNDVAQQCQGQDYVKGMIALLSFTQGKGTNVTLLSGDLQAAHILPKMQQWVFTAPVLDRIRRLVCLFLLTYCWVIQVWAQNSIKVENGLSSPCTLC